MSIKYDFELDDMVQIALEEFCTKQRINLTKLKTNIRRLVQEHTLPISDPVFWPNGFLALGLEEWLSSCQVESQDLCQLVESALDNYFYTWKKQGFKVQNIDDCITGSALIKWSKMTNAPIVEGADAVFRFVLDSERDKTGAIRYQHSNAVYADGVGQAAFFLYDYYLLTGNSEAYAMGVEQSEIFLNTAIDRRIGLPYHAFRTDSGGIERLGIIGWGRAIGWLLLGISRYSELEKYSKALLDYTFDFLREDGTLPWLFPASEAPGNSSALSMIAYAAILGGYSSSYPVSLLIDGISSSVDESGRIQHVLAECQGAGLYPQYFKHTSFGQGIALAALSCWLKSCGAKERFTWADRG